MSIFSTLFTPAKQEPAAAATPASVANNPAVPSAANNPPNPQVTKDGKPASPLDNYADLWKNDANANPDTPFTLKSDPAALLDAAKTVDFTQVITPEMRAKIEAGGPDAMKAMMEVSNLVSQMTFAQSAHASAKITESAMQSMEQRFKDMLPSIIKQHSVQETLRTENPLLTNPAMAPMVEALQQQFTRKYPQATAAEIKAHVNDYLNGAATLIKDGQPKPADPTKKQEQNWEKFFS